MVRKRGKAKRSYGIKRAKRQRIKLDPRTISLRFKEKIEPMALDLSMWLVVLDELEKRVMNLCQAQGIPTQELVNYFAYSKKQFKTLNRFEALTRWIKIQETLAEFIIRGIRETKGKEIIPLLEQLLEDKRLFFDTGEIQLIHDYLRFMFKAYVIIPIPFYCELRPRNFVIFSTATRPLTSRTLSLKPRASVSVGEYTLPLTSRSFQLNLVNKISSEVLYLLTTIYKRVFDLHPITALMLDYRISSYKYFEALMEPKVYLEFLKGILALTSRAIEVKPKIILQLLNYIKPLPIRTFNLKPKISFLLLSYPLLTLPALQELHPTPEIIPTAKPLTPERTLTTLKPKVSMEFSYNVGGS
ncbi:MAG: hypothetical protein QW423_03480 [Candidatus Aenigmatarchaeota archaeon]